MYFHAQALVAPYMNHIYIGCGIFHCDSIKYYLMLHWISVECDVYFQVKNYYVGDCTISVLFSRSNVDKSKLKFKLSSPLFLLYKRFNFLACHYTGTHFLFSVSLPKIAFSFTLCCIPRLFQNFCQSSSKHIYLTDE